MGRAPYAPETYAQAALTSKTIRKSNLNAARPISQIWAYAVQRIFRQQATLRTNHRVTKVENRYLQRCRHVHLCRLPLNGPALNCPAPQIYLIRPACASLIAPAPPTARHARAPRWHISFFQFQSAPERLFRTPRCTTVYCSSTLYLFQIFKNVPKFPGQAGLFRYKPINTAC